MQKLGVVACAVVLAGLVRMGNCFIGSCPNQELIKNFDEAGFMGLWYEFGKYASVNQIFDSCVQHDFIPGTNGIIKVETSYIALNKKYTKYGELKRSVPGGTNSNYTITYNKDGFTGKENDITDANYQIVYADLGSFAIVWTCTAPFIFNFQYVRVFTRSREVEDEVTLDRMKTEMERRDLSWFWLTRTHQKNCTDLNLN